jgi:CHAT domain-containing protein
VVSLWSVDDTATAELMTRFYVNLFGGGKRSAEALRKAQLAMFAENRWRSPYFWAAFTAQGEWR